MQPDIERLVEKALLAGASAATVIAPEAVVIDPQLAALCTEPRCENYGLSKSCPPLTSLDRYIYWH